MPPQIPEQKTQVITPNSSVECCNDSEVNNNFVQQAGSPAQAAASNKVAQGKIDEIKNRRSRNLIKKCLWQLSSNLNVLVVGAKESGELVCLCYKNSV